MGFTILKYGITRNLQDYNSVRVDAEYQLADNECPNTAFKTLKEFVENGELPSQPVEDKAVEEIPVIEEEKPKKKTRKRRTKTEEKVEKAIEEVVEAAPVIEEKKVEEVKAKASRAVADDEPILYSRKTQGHKKTLAELLDKLIPAWNKNSATMSKAKELSMALEDVPMSNKKGDILDSFKEKITNHFK